jgi:hypothetical protein
VRANSAPIRGMLNSAGGQLADELPGVLLCKSDVGMQRVRRCVQMLACLLICRPLRGARVVRVTSFELVPACRSGDKTNANYHSLSLVPAPGAKAKVRKLWSVCVALMRTH